MTDDCSEELLPLLFDGIAEFFELELPHVALPCGRFDASNKVARARRTPECLIRSVRQPPSTIVPVYQRLRDWQKTKISCREVRLDEALRVDVRRGKYLYFSVDDLTDARVPPEKLLVLEVTADRRSCDRIVDVQTMHNVGDTYPGGTVLKVRIHRTGPREIWILAFVANQEEPLWARTTVRFDARDECRVSGAILSRKRRRRSHLPIGLSFETRKGEK